ncbi:DUF2065 family protein [Arenimonas aestuarii]
MPDLWAALCLVLVLEGLLLFAAPGAWKRAVAQLMALGDRPLRITGAVMIGLGLLALQWARG